LAHSPFLRLPSRSSVFLRHPVVADLVAAVLIAIPLTIAAQAPAPQQPAPAPATTQQNQSAPTQPEQQPTPAPPQPPSATPHESAEPQAVAAASVAPNGAKLPVTLDILHDRLVGKQFFLRGGWLGDSLSFTERGIPVNNPKTGSFTLSLVEISSVKWDSHRVEIEGTRYALHFLGNLPYETTAHEVERISLSKKRPLRISIARAKVEKGKKVSKPVSNAAKPAAAATPSPETTEPIVATPASPEPAGAATPVANGTPVESAKPIVNLSQAAQILNDALERIFAPALDTTLRSQLPEFWQLYYESQRTGKRFDPHNANVFYPATVDRQAKVLSSITPQSNEYAQANNIVGMALYRVVIGADGVPQRVAAERPIGFGLDENAVAAIQKATFQPAMKNGQPVAELVALSVIFRIYSDRTNPAGAAGLSIQGADAAAPAPAPAAVKPALPGPFAAPQPAQQPSATQPEAAPAADTPPAQADPATTTPQAQPAPQTPPAPPQTAPTPDPHTDLHTDSQS